MTPGVSFLRQVLLPRWVLPVICISVYALFFFFLDAFLSEKIFRDTSKIELIAEGGTVTNSRSFGGTADFFQLIPAEFRNLFIFLTGSTVIGLMISRTTLLGAMLGMVLVAPAVLLSLFGPSKEILVFCMSILIVLSYNSDQSSTAKMLSTVLLYLAYGFTVRSYYFLIIATYVVILLWTTRITELRIVIVGMAAITIVLIPDEIYHVLQSARDSSIVYLKYTSPHIVRTLIENPFSPAGFLSFLLNYSYAFMVCVFPLIIDYTPKEFILIIFNLVCAFLLVVGFRSKNKAACSLSCLFLAHFVVLLLFEPDLGSYLRHLSSAVLYLLSSMLAWEKPDADDLRPSRPVSGRASSRRCPEPRRACALAGSAPSPDGGRAAWRAG